MARKKSFQEKYGDLPKIPVVEVEDGSGGKHRDKVNNFKDTLQSLSTTEIAQEYTKLRDTKDDIEEELKDVNSKLTAIVELLNDRFDEDGVDAIRTKTGYLISANPQPYASVKNKEAYLKWARENGYENLLTIMWQSTNSITKELLENGMAPPDGVEVFLKPGLRLTRS